MDFVWSKSIGCGSVANLLVGGVGGTQTEEREEEGRVTEHVGAVAELFGITAWGRVAL